MTQTSKLERDIFKKGYTDAYYGKDKSDMYDSVDYLIYKQGQEKFFQEYFNELDVMKELNG